MHVEPTTGMCPLCDVVGVRCANSMVYTSALAMVPGSSPARQLWKNHPVVQVDTKKLGTKGRDFNQHVEKQMKKKLVMRTTEEAVNSGLRALQATTKEAARQEPFKGVSVYCTLFPGDVDGRVAIISCNFVIYFYIFAKYSCHVAQVFP